MKEGININKELFLLGQVVSKLLELGKSNSSSGGNGNGGRGRIGQRVFLIFLIVILI